MSSSPIKAFFFKVVLWLPVCFAAWYFMAIVLTLPLAGLVRTALLSLFPQAFDAVIQNGFLLEVVSTVAPTRELAGAPESGRQAVISFDINPLKYGYSLPLFAGLVLAAPGNETQRLGRIVLGLLVLLPIQAYGVSTEALKILVFDIGADVISTTALSREMLALAYQLGYLILPMISPVVLWIVLHRRFLAQLAPSLGRSAADESHSSR